LGIIAVLLAFGANQRGLNDYTALLMAVSEENLTAIALLLEAGADPWIPTRIDECETPREMAEKAGLREIARVLASQEGRR
jgi:ankyrin repeat protein